MILKTGIHYGYMQKGKFYQRENGDTAEVVSVFDNGSIRGYCAADDVSIKKEIQAQIDQNDRGSINKYYQANY